MNLYDVVRSKSLGLTGQIVKLPHRDVAVVRFHAFEDALLASNDLVLWHGDPYDSDTRHGAPTLEMVRSILRKINEATGDELDDLWDEYEALTGLTARGEERDTRNGGRASRAPSRREFAAPRPLIYEEQSQSAQE